MQKISHDGDLVLVMDQSIRLIVSSAHLIAASSTFKAMLTGPFAEGQHTISPKEIELPDDDSASMIILMNILHQKNHFVPVSLEPQQMLMVAGLADKYDCTASVKSVSYTWFHEITTAPISKLDHITLIATSYLLNDHRTFRFHTRSLVMEYSWTVGELLSKLDRGAFSDAKRLELALAMERQRSEVFERLESVKSDLTRCSNQPSTGCVISASTISDIKTFLHGNIDAKTFVDFAKITSKDVIDRLRTYKATEARRCGHKHLTVEETEEALLAIVKRAEDLTCGLCLICLRKGSECPENCTDRFGLHGDLA